MPKIILGIDPGIADTGYGVIKEEGSCLSCLTYGSIKTSPKDDLITRLDILNRELDKIIKKYKPDLASVEELFFNKNVRTALIVGQARGVALLTLKQNNLQIVEFTPSRLSKQFPLTGRPLKSKCKKWLN